MECYKAITHKSNMIYERVTNLLYLLLFLHALILIVLFWSPSDPQEQNIVLHSSWSDAHKPISFLQIVKWVFPKIGVPQNGRFIMIMDDLGVPLFLETPKYTKEQSWYCFYWPTVHLQLGYETTVWLVRRAAVRWAVKSSKSSEL